MATIPQGELTIPPDVAELILAQVEQGAYASSEDVLRDAMHALEQRGKLRALRAKVEASLRDPRPAMTPGDVRAHLRRRTRALPEGHA